MDLNNFNENNNNMQNGFQQPEMPEQYQYTGFQSGYTYYPENGGSNNGGKKKKGGAAKKAAMAVGAVALAAVISVGSIFGYKLITGGSLSDNLVENSSSAADDTSAVDADAPAENASKEEERPRREVPSLEQLAALEDALPVPEIVEKVSPSVVGVTSLLSGGTSYGTGFVISQDGYIVTNYHVIDGAQKITVAFSVSDDDEEYDAELIGGDEQTDIAVLKIDKDGLTAVEFGKSSDLIVGELAIAIGNPMGSELSGTVTAGIISALNRTLTIEERKMNLIQTDASINNGNSGGPLINSYGQIIGITSAKIASYYADGLGFAIPIDEALPIISDLIEYGYVKGRPVIGISGEDISEIYAQYYDVPQGFYVAAVTEDGPAEKAGVKVGDIVIGIESQLVNSIDEFNEIKAKYKAGDTITISVYRDKEIIDLKVTLAEDTSAIDKDEDNTQNNNNNFDDDFGNFGYNPFFNFGY